MQTVLVHVLLWTSYFLAATQCLVTDTLPVSLPPPPEQSTARTLPGEWSQAREELAKSDCCVVSVNGLENCLSILQTHLIDNPRALRDVDLRARIRTSGSNDDILADCHKVQHMVKGESDNQEPNLDNCTHALAELAKGMSSSLCVCSDDKKSDVFLRIVCASDYRARDPMFHTDKAPLRGYVTLCGVGTELLTRIAAPWEYASLRTLGRLVGTSSSSSSPDSSQANPQSEIRQANINEFIIMKGDYYYDDLEVDELTKSPTNSNIRERTKHSTKKSMPWWSQLWQRSFACIHRSPPAPSTGGRRVIISLDLDDGRDDREWLVSDYKREWRSGMTQRKSKFVA